MIQTACDTMTVTLQPQVTVSNTTEDWLLSKLYFSCNKLLFQTIIIVSVFFYSACYMWCPSGFNPGTIIVFIIHVTHWYYI